MDLQAAADELGVHYQTAYRWVRSGRLPAVRVRGRYEVSPSAVRAVAAERDRPAPAVPTARARDWSRHAALVVERLLAGDETDVRRSVLRLVEEGTPIVDVVSEVLVPAMVRIGQGWADGEVSIAQEHRASVITERLLAAVSPIRRGRRRGRVTVAALSGDHHVLPTAMAAAVLREAGWQVEQLGAEVPADVLVTFALEASADAVVLTVTNPEVTSTAQDTAAALRAAGVPSVIGGPGRSVRDLAPAVAEAVAEARTVLPQP